MPYSTDPKLQDGWTRAQESPNKPCRFPQGTPRGQKFLVMSHFISLELTGSRTSVEFLDVPLLPGAALSFSDLGATLGPWRRRQPVTSPLLPTYARAELSFEKGEGPWLFGRDGERYLDFGAGIAVNALGHAHPHLVQALTEQASKVWHTSNLFRIPEGERLAKRLVDNTFADFVFFANSGAEANEAAIKMARRYHYANGNPERFHIVTFEGAFHGRTLGTIAAGGQEKYLEGFGPKVQGFDQVPPEDIEALKAVIGPQTAALMIEPIQGEGGVRTVSNAFLRELRALCDSHGLLLIFDEIQTGVGRTGKLFAYEWSGVTPDIMAGCQGNVRGVPTEAS